jgi:hypothetical protein
MNTAVLREPSLNAASKRRTTVGVSGFWQRVWAALQRQGEQRAVAELRRAASIHRFSDPELTRQLLAAADFAERS